MYNIVLISNTKKYMTNIKGNNKNAKTLSNKKEKNTANLETSSIINIFPKKRIVMLLQKKNKQKLPVK